MVTRTGTTTRCGRRRTGVSEKLELRNFVGGESVDAVDGRRSDLIDPSTGEVFATAPVSGAEDVDRAYRAAAEAFETWRDTTPSDRQRALLRLVDLVEEHAEELVALESQNTGKPIGLTASEEIPPMVDQIRFFAGAARTLEGKAAAEYLAGHTTGSAASRSGWSGRSRRGTTR
jgi:betaine-aldehyde dehydrogenase